MSIEMPVFVEKSRLFSILLADPYSNDNPGFQVSKARQKGGMGYRIEGMSALVSLIYPVYSSPNALRTAALHR